MRHTKYIKVIILHCLSFTSIIGQTDAYYVAEVARLLQGQQEVRLEGGRADVVTSDYAIEVEFAPKWKQAIGQALFYALRTNKQAGIVLVIQNITERKYALQLQSTIDYAGLSDKIKVWFYPEDFGLGYEQATINYQSSYQASRPASSSYSRNRNSGVRHNSSCTYYNCSNCVPCGAGDGKKACGKCGG